MYWYQILVAAVVAALYELAAHWFPWQMLLRRKLPRPAAYIVGVLGFMLPVMALLVMWQIYMAVYAVVVVVSAAGLAVLAARWVDHLMARMVKANEMEERYGEKEAQGRASQARFDSQA